MVTKLILPYYRENTKYNNGAKSFDQKETSVFLIWNDQKKLRENEITKSQKSGQKQLIALKHVSQFKSHSLHHSIKKTIFPHFIFFFFALVIFLLIFL